MTLPDIIKIMENKLQNLNQVRTSIVMAGDLEGVTKIDNDIAETEATLVQLKKTLESVSAG